VTWLKLDDSFADHPKVDPLSDQAFRLHVAALCFCAHNLTDGRIPEGRPERLVRGFTAELVAELEDARLWLRKPDGWVVHDYLRYNPTAREAKTKREQRRAAGSRGGKTTAKRKAANAQANAAANTQASAQAEVERVAGGLLRTPSFHSTSEREAGPAPSGGPLPIEPELVAANVNGVRSLRQQLHGEAS
jgi:hypothetical protein